MLKILGGVYRSRRLIEPSQREPSRPYEGRLREAVCNLLRGWFEDARVLDLFAGVGTMGLEAVSRGASDVVMVEKNRQTYEKLRQNIDALGVADRARSVMGDALSMNVLNEAPRPVDLLFVDPPYAMLEDAGQRARVLRQISECRRVMAERSFCVLRSPVSPDDVDLTIEGWNGPEPHRYGSGKWILLYEPAMASAGSSADAG